jgi:hypothetical protein
MTPLQIEERARQRLNALQSTFWTSQEIIENYLYNAASELAVETLCIQNRYTTVSVAGQSEYTLPTKLISAKRVVYDTAGSNSKLKPIDFRTLDSISPEATGLTTGTPQYYLLFDDVIQLYPTPDTSGLSILIQSYDMPDQTTSMSVLEIPCRYHHMLVVGVAYLMSLKELGHPNTALLSRQWFEYIEKVKRIEKRLLVQDGFNRVLREEDLPGTLLGSI